MKHQVKSRTETKLILFENRLNVFYLALTSNPKIHASAEMTIYNRKWKVDIAINNFTYSKVEMSGALAYITAQDLFYPEHTCGISHNMTHIHG